MLEVPFLHQLDLISFGGRAVAGPFTEDSIVPGTWQECLSFQ